MSTGSSISDRNSGKKKMTHTSWLHHTTHKNIIRIDIWTNQSIRFEWIRQALDEHRRGCEQWAIDEITGPSYARSVAWYDIDIGIVWNLNPLPHRMHYMHINRRHNVDDKQMSLISNLVEMHFVIHSCQPNGHISVWSVNANQQTLPLVHCDRRCPSVRNHWWLCAHSEWNTYAHSNTVLGWVQLSKNLSKHCVSNLILFDGNSSANV